MSVPQVCRKGHDLGDPANLYVKPSGKTTCRLCKQERARRYRQRRKEMTAQRDREYREATRPGLEPQPGAPTTRAPVVPPAGIRSVAAASSETAARLRLARLVRGL